MALQEFTVRSECESALLNEFSCAIDKDLTTQKRVAIALAGGNTPKILYEKLGSTQINWSNVVVTLTDERWVNVNHADSNERMLKEYLFHGPAKMALFLGLKNPEKTPEVGQIRTAHLLKKNITKLDYVVLGMGDDGHFASIFPNMVNTKQLLDLDQTEPCLAAYPSGKPPRMSLTFQYLLSAKKIFLFISGQDKLVLIKKVLAGEETSLPIYQLLQQTLCPVEIYWSES